MQQPWRTAAAAPFGLLSNSADVSLQTHMRTSGGAVSQAYRTHSQVSPDGTLRLENLPFRPGEEVEVIVLAEERRARSERRYPLRGQPLTFEHPTEPVAGSDRQAFQ